MPVTVRADLASLPDYVAGRKVPGAVILSSNELSGQAPASVLAAIAEAAADVNRYPAMGCDDLMDRTAEHFGVDRARLAVGCGSVSLCQQVIQALCQEGDEVLFAWRSFEAYPIVTQIAMARGVKVPLVDQAIDPEGLLSAVTDRTRVMFVANPNNPTGTALRTAELTSFLDRVPDDVLVVLDEAYREFVTDPDVPDGLTFLDRQNVAVLRTFSKAYALAGIRLGYLVADLEIAAAVRKVGIPFSVNRVAQAAGIAAMTASAELMARCREVVEERPRVRAALVELGYDVPESQANFLWLPLGERTAAFNEHCLDQKVVIRAFAGEGVRATIGLPAENDAFLAAARTFPR
ncbi:histidinol-phosphate transaminase [Actinophytocola oryzae]|uniref:Histidinol-phosphate aminotransferase n=1 Tax=Actinophytocola oryzae TaxID=502181 RepID=A0A4R7VWJ9_9PSEU|nr:histidinol-phosphate transaminase [Actinophytocola oryzae]TDV54025.1 histidinol-phosphate aminotransferase [Actinophytocola oryzae]